MKKQIERIKELNEQGLLTDIAGEGLKQILNDFDPIVTVNRRPKIKYPDYITGLVYPEFEKACPKKFDVRNIQKWQHPGQLQLKPFTKMSGDPIRKFLLENNLFASQVGLIELMALQERGISFLHLYLGEDSGSGTLTTRLLYGWRSMGKCWDSNIILVPFLLASGNSCFIDWSGIGDNEIGGGCYCLQYASQQCE